MDAPDSIQPMACCVDCGHFATVHHGGGGGKPGGSSCASPGCECRRFVEGTGVRVPVDEDYLRPAGAAQLIEVSVHTLSYWRQSGRGPKPTKVGSRVLYQRREIERWLATLDGFSAAEKQQARGGQWRTGRRRPRGWRRPSRRQAESSPPIRHPGSSRVPMPCCPSPTAWLAGVNQRRNLRELLSG
jgi:hypothetical protein